jgi:hypothetical protein
LASTAQKPVRRRYSGIDKSSLSVQNIYKEGQNLKVAVPHEAD